MAIFDLFSKRQAREQGGIADVLIYDSVPERLRIQIVHLVSDTLGDYGEYLAGYRTPRVMPTYKFIVDALRLEYGVFELVKSRGGNDDYHYELLNFILTAPVDRLLDTIELIFSVIEASCRDWAYLGRNDRINESIDDLNARFLQNGFGYQLQGGLIVRTDSLLVHGEIVKPALVLLSDARFKGAEQEYRLAYEHYRHGRNKEALNECLKALESTIKTIATIRNWRFNQTDTAKVLIDVCLTNQLIPSFWQNQFSALRAMLESSVPTGRNKLSGHGQGVEPTEVPNHIAAYMLHMTASAIVFLVAAERSR